MSAPEQASARRSALTTSDATGATGRELTEQEKRWLRNLEDAVRKAADNIDIAKAFGRVSAQARGTSVALDSFGKAASKVGSAFDDLTLKPFSSDAYTYPPPHFADAVRFAVRFGIGTTEARRPNFSLDVPSTPTLEAQSW